MKRLLLLLSLLSCVTVFGEDMRNAPLDLSPAKWIWYPCGRTLQNTFVQFRKEFTLESAPAEAGGWILADSRYRLYVNGRRVQFGPAPCDPRWQEADPVNLAPYLTQGRNAIAVEVCFFGTGDGTTPFGKPGLIMKLDVDGREIVTDKSWSCLLSRSWTPGQYKRAYLRSLQESFDARLYPYGWDEAGFEQDSDWVAAAETSEGGDKPSVCTSGKDYLWGSYAIGDNQQIRRRSIPLMEEYEFPVSGLEESVWLEWKRPVEDFFDANAYDCFEVVRQPSARETGEGVWTVSPDAGRAAVLTFSFKEQGVGWPQFSIDAPEGTVVELLVHEAHEVGGPALMNSHFNSWTRFVCKEGLNRFETFDFESFRWVQLHIRNFDRPVTVSSVGMRRRVYPRTVKPEVRISDPVIQKVMDASINTLNNCAQETLVDGMARERQQYSGDGSHQLHSVFQILGDSALPFRYVNTFSQGSSIEGYFMDSWPAWDRLARLIERQMGLSGWGPIIDHSIGFCFDCRHYYMYTGDLQGLEEVYPRLVKFFNYLKGLTDKDTGLVPAENLGLCTVYIDHLAYRKDRHKQLPLNLYIAAMCSDALAPLCREMGDLSVAEEVEEYGREVLAACRARFWDPVRETFVTNLPWEKEEGGPRYDDRSLSTALIYDLCPEGKSCASLEILASRPDELGQCYPCNAVWPLWALTKYHRIDIVLDDLREKWGGMRSVWDNNTLQEFWTANPDEGSQWSHCAMYPLIALTQGIAGVSPLEPGGRKVRMEPQLGDLEEVEFDIQTVRGPIHFLYNGKGRHKKLSLSVPPAVSVELVLGRGRDKGVHTLEAGRHSFTID